MMLARYPIVKNSIRRPLIGSIRCYTGGTQKLNGFEQFNNRERAKEDFFIRQHEKEQKDQLKEQVKDYEDKINHLNTKINEIEKKHKEQQDDKSGN